MMEMFFATMDVFGISKVVGFKQFEQHLKDFWGDRFPVI